MIAYIKGKVHSYNKDSVIIENNGIGYRIFMSNPSCLILNEEIMIYTYQQIREDAHTLYGFVNVEDHDLFLRLISVKGIGAKIAMQALSASSSAHIIHAIESNNAAELKKLPGIGPKAASQIVLDLKGKLVESDEVDSVMDHELQDALDALKALGYKNNEVLSVKKELQSQKGKTCDEYIRLGLSLLLKKKGL